MNIIAEQLQGLFRWQQRLLGVPETFEKFFLRIAIFFTRQQAKDALPEFRIGVCGDGAQRGDIVIVAGLKSNDAEARCLKRLEGRKPNFDRLTRVAKYVQHCLQGLIVFTDGCRHARQGGNPLLDSLARVTSDGEQSAGWLNGGSLLLPRFRYLQGLSFHSSLLVQCTSGKWHIIVIEAQRRRGADGALIVQAVPDVRFCARRAEAW